MRRWLALVWLAFAACVWLTAARPRDAQAVPGFFPFPGQTCKAVSANITVSSAQDAPDTGGSIQITGGGFDATYGMTAEIGYPASVTVAATSVTSTTLNIQVPALTAGGGTGPNGEYVLTLFKNTECNGYNAGPILVVSTNKTPSTIMGSDLKYWHEADTGTDCGGTCTDGALGDAWNDKTANAVNYAASSTARPTWHTDGSNHFNGHPFFTGDGSANSFKATAATYGTHDHCEFVVWRLLTNSAKNLTYYNNEQLATDGSGIPRAKFAASAVNAIGSASALNTSLASMACFHGTGANATTTTYAGNNIAAPTDSNVVAPEPSSAANDLYLLSSTGATSPINAEVAADWGTDSIPNSTQLAQLQAYAHIKFGIEPKLAFVSGLLAPLGMTNVVGGSAGRTARLYVSGLNASSTFSIQGYGAQTLTIKSSSCADLTGLPSMVAGVPLDYTVTNTNNLDSVTVNNGITPVSSAGFDVMSAAGIKIVADLRADSKTLNGSNVSSLLDLTCLANDINQPTAGNQPAWNATDADYCATCSSVTTTGSPQTLTTAGTHTMIRDTGTSADVWILSVSKLTDNAASHDLLNWSGGVNNRLRTINGTDVEIRATSGNNTAAWGSGVYNARKKIYIYNTQTGSPAERLGISVEFGAEVTTTAANANLAWPSAFFLFDANAALYWRGTWREEVILDVMPTSQEITDLQTAMSNAYP